MNSLFQELKPNQRKGSKPRCHLLTHGRPEQVADWLTGLIAPYGSVAAHDHWRPEGFIELEEAQLHKARCLIAKDSYRQELKSWWLAVSRGATVTPNWDLASTCTIDGKRGILLVEAKAHHEELKSNDSGGAKGKNLARIGEAIQSANEGLNNVQEGWKLSHESHYQLCNRMAWSWKLATLGIPVALVYLGFLNADEMPNPFSDAQAWKNAVRDYARDFVPDSAWDSKLMIGSTPIYPLIRSMNVRLNSIGGPVDTIDTIDVKDGMEV